MTQEIINAPGTNIVLSEKQIQQWQSFAITFNSTLQNLQLNCSAISSRLSVMPTDLTQIKEYELTLATAKRELASLEDDVRKPFTNKLNVLIERQMQPNKDAQLSVVTYAVSLLELKKQAAEIDRKSKAKAAEYLSMREYFANHIITINSQIETGIMTAVTNCFKYAMKNKSETDTSPNIDVASLETYLKTVLASKKYSADVFVTNKPAHISPCVYLELKEIDLIWDDVFKEKSLSPQFYRDLFVEKLENIFFAYEVSLTNRAASLQIAKQEQSETAAAAESEKLNAQIAAKLEATAQIELPKVDTGKNLKKVFKLNLQNNEANLRLVLTALIADADKLLPLIKTKTFFETICSVLETQKNKDNQSSWSGIKFEETTKL